MNKLSILREAFEKKELSKEVQDYMDAITNGIKSTFPDSYVSASFDSNLGEAITIYFTIGKDNSEYINQISDNDPLYTSIMLATKTINGFKGGEVLPSELEMSPLRFRKFYLKGYDFFKNPKAFVKVPFSKKTGNPEVVKKYIIDYFKKVKQLLIANKDNLQSDILKSKI
jgi:hypothetical protein